MELKGSKRKREAQALVDELNELCPEIEKHTYVTVYKKYALENKIRYFWEIIGYVAGLIGIICFFIAIMLPLLRLMDGRALLWGHEIISIALCVSMLMIYKWCKGKEYACRHSGAKEVGWNQYEIEQLQQKLTEAREALAKYETRRKEAQPLIEKFEELEELEATKAVVTDFAINDDKTPFRVSGVILEDDFTYFLTERGYEKLTTRIACAYYTKTHLPDFEKILQS